MPKVALILAGGLGTRLRPITYKIPKPLVKINGKPTLEHIIDELKGNGIGEIVISIGYKGQKIVNYFKKRKIGAKISYVQEKEPLGTGGALKLALKNPKIKREKEIFVCYGDEVFTLDIKKLYSFHKKNNAQVTLTLKKVNNVTGSGVVVLKKNKVVQFVEKPDPRQIPSKTINIGKYIIDVKALNTKLPKTRKFSFEKEFLQNNVKKMRVFGYVSKGKLYATDNLQKLENARKHWKKSSR